MQMHNCDRRLSHAQKVICSFIVAAAPAALADPVVLTFEGLLDLEPVDQFYLGAGGLGGFGSGPGPSFGIGFTDSMALVAYDAGGNGNFANNPSGFTVAFFLDGGGAVMNVPSGFETGFSLFYAAAFEGSVSLYDDLNAGGNLLATLDLPATPLGTFPEPTYYTWVPVGIAFDGVVRSVDFTGAANFIGFDDITLGSVVPGVVPEHTGLSCLAGAGLYLLGLHWFACARNRKSVA
ncbi:MAG TPA: PEP-CTERM sorting domain-containing protein [Verrucomicrobiota bacterium]|nr:PEP-CTERM sorting domain-containing protein [Verrucomicrobiales bacterium]HRI11621.1 PEP-CTERM sorting domain-containing protein [Verrucomicrobiota bacterium]